MKIPEFVRPKQIVFDDAMDIVKYTAGGVFPPNKKTFQSVMNTMESSPTMNSHGDGDYDGDQLQIVGYTPDGTEIVINGCVNDDMGTLRGYMEEVYKHRCRRRNAFLIIAGIVTIGVIASKVNHHNKKKEEEVCAASYVLEVPEDMK